MRKYIVIILILVLIVPFFLTRCSGDEPVDDGPVINPAPPLAIEGLKNGEDQFTIGETVTVNLTIKDPSKVTGIQVFLDDTLYQSGLASDTKSFTIDTKNSRTGFIHLTIKYMDDKGESRSDTRTLVLFSDIAPVQKKAISLKSFPHDKTSYTQGLEFYNGKLFEGTGHMGQSVLAEVDLQSSKHTRSLPLGPTYFGEGITILNDTIYQITWQNKTCFVYDMNFTPVKELNYEGEGWGLCNNGKSIIMTNGTNEVVWRNPRTFEIERKINVFDDEHSIEQLNEIELINGRLFANVYGENYIVEVDTATGKVLSRIDCSAIEKEGRTPGADVLNGIAYDPKSGKTYLTGKWWPTLFEVRFE